MWIRHIRYGEAQGRLKTVITSYSIHYTKLYDNSLVVLYRQVRCQPGGSDDEDGQDGCVDAGGARGVQPIEGLNRRFARRPSDHDGHARGDGDFVGVRAGDSAAYRVITSYSIHYTKLYDIYAFATRELPGTFKRGWAHERLRLSKKGKSFWSRNNFV